MNNHSCCYLSYFTVGLFLFLLGARDRDIYLSEKIDFLKVLALVQMTGGENVLSPFNEEVFL